MSAWSAEATEYEIDDGEVEKYGHTITKLSCNDEKKSYARIVLQIHNAFLFGMTKVFISSPTTLIHTRQI